MLELGRVAGSYGVRGWIRVERPQAALGDCGKWWVGGTEYAVEATKVHSGALLAKLAGIGSRETALKLKGSPVSVRREALPDPGEGHYYLADLIGLAVVNGQDEALGVVKRMFTNSAQDVMEVAAGGKTRLLPWVSAVVKKVDLAGKRVYVEWEADW